MRPFARFSNGRGWREGIAQAGNVDAKQLFRGHSWSGRYVCAIRHYLNVEELVEFIFNRMIVRGQRLALMQNINFADIFCSQYSAVIISVPLGTFIWRFTKSADLGVRIKIEMEQPQNKMPSEGEKQVKGDKPPKGKKKHPEANLKKYLNANVK
jgi:hypothetical protein